jgi:L-amino acid N-acyltransferase YncA
MSTGNIVVAPMLATDWPEVERIYIQGITSKNGTFETQSPGWEAWDKAHRIDCRLVAKADNKVVGWAALSNVSARKVYAGVVESSVYIDGDYRGKGVGDKLMTELVEQSELKGIWTMQAGIFPENVASLRLHEKHGFRILGIREKIGKMDDKWRDVLLMERRSRVVNF